MIYLAITFLVAGITAIITSIHYSEDFSFTIEGFKNLDSAASGIGFLLLMMSGIFFYGSLNL